MLDNQTSQSESYKIFKKHYPKIKTTFWDNHIIPKCGISSFKEYMKKE